jgi:hypothetical protein
MCPSFLIKPCRKITQAFSTELGVCQQLASRPQHNVNAGITRRKAGKAMSQASGTVSLEIRVVMLVDC